MIADNVNYYDTLIPNYQALQVETLLKCCVFVYVHILNFMHSFLVSHGCIYVPSYSALQYEKCSALLWEGSASDEEATDNEVSETTDNED